VPIAAIVLLVSYVSSHMRHAEGSDALSAQAISQRVQPVGESKVKDVTDVATLDSGEKVFNGVCISCHGSGMLGAPKFGDSAAWGPRIAQGYDTLLHSALNGKGSMPKQAGGDYADLEIARAVAYMANQAGAKFPEPKLAAQPAAAAASEPATAVAAAAAPAPASAGTVVPETTAQAPQPAAAAVPALYTQTCAVCHGAGIAGAPKVGDKAAWAPRLAQGVDGLTASAIKGKGAMPPKGGANASDADIKAVVTYMVSQAK